MIPASYRAVSLALLACGGLRAMDSDSYGCIYPSPNTTRLGGWQSAVAKPDAFLSQLTLDEAVADGDWYTRPVFRERGVHSLPWFQRYVLAGWPARHSPGRLRQCISYPSYRRAVLGSRLDLLEGCGEAPTMDGTGRLFSGSLSQPCCDGIHDSGHPICWSPSIREPYIGTNKRHSVSPAFLPTVKRSRPTPLTLTMELFMNSTRRLSPTPLALACRASRAVTTA
ncbi:hypothetical protein OE88DRAFT_1081497 [Heliocybe sulcata]|uniref:Uncharacterized protein n=1 Tax=Heliocybe sulcata TaxID=5364 RepID=A0A5C3MN66_9AGAM|nr:hypothetical protein OE88DRAFT_1081497 [Heliocybe sulcata]